MGGVWIFSILKYEKSIKNAIIIYIIQNANFKLWRVFLGPLNTYKSVKNRDHSIGKVIIKYKVWFKYSRHFKCCEKAELVLLKVYAYIK